MEFLKFTMEKCNHRTDISPVAVFYSVCTPECQRKTKAMSVLHRRWKEGRKISESDMRTVKIHISAREKRKLKEKNRRFFKPCHCERSFQPIPRFSDIFFLLLSSAAVAPCCSTISASFTFGD